MKNVLVLLHDDEGQEARLQAALELTRGLAGHLMCLDLIVPPTAMSDYFEVSGGAIMMEYLREREAKNLSAIERRLQAEGVSWSLAEKTGAPGRELRHAADLADIIVVSIPGEDAEPEFRGVVGELAVKSERPVLAVPAASRRFDIAGKAVVGWNCSHEASEALRQAVPLLQRAASVTLVTVNRPDGERPVEEAAAYLARHGIEASIVARESNGRAVTDLLLDEGHALGASYLVLGAYGIPRLVEAMFGGVTDGMLHKTDVPLLLAR